MILFFTYWFPDWHRARIVSGFMVALPLAVATGAPMSTALLELNGLWGLAGWQGMFIAEAIPTVLVGIFLLFCVTDRPHLARWLSKDERGWLISTLETERRLVEAKCKISLWESFWNPKALWLAMKRERRHAVVPAKQLGLTNMQVGWVTMIPYLCAVVAMLAWGWVSDRLSERRWTLSLACLISSVGLLIAAQNLGTVWALVGMSIAAMGFYGSKGPFWAIPSMILTGTAAASGIAWINSVGNLGGFFGPTMVGWAKDYTGSFAGGLYALAGFALMSAVISALWLRIPNPVRQELASVPAE